MVKQILLIGIISLFSSVITFGQDGLVLHFMDDIQQSSKTNPAIFPRHRVNANILIPIPTLSINIAHSGFTFNHLIKQNSHNDSTYIDGDEVLQKMGKKNLISANINLDYFSTNFRYKQYRFMASATEKISINMLYPKQLFEFLWNGNVQFEGQTIDIGMSLKTLHYREYAIGGGYDFQNEGVTVGMRLKYLQGLSCIHTKNTEIKLTTGGREEAFAYNFMTNYEVNIGGVSGTESLDFGDYFFGKNPGFGIDIGGTYNYYDDFSFSAGLIDLGFIKWKERIENHHSNGEYYFKGVDINDFLVKNVFGVDSVNVSFDEYIKTLKEEFNFDTTHNSFTTSLITKMYLSGKYHIDSTSFVGLLFHTEFFEGVRPAVTVAYNKRFGKVFTIGGYYSYKNRSFLNVGISTLLDVRPFQFYMATDNFMGPIFPRHSKNVNFQIGINWTFDGKAPDFMNKRTKKRMYKKTKIKNKDKPPPKEDKEIFEDVLDE